MWVNREVGLTAVGGPGGECSPPLEERGEDTTVLFPPCFFLFFPLFEVKTRMFKNIRISV